MTTWTPTTLDDVTPQDIIDACDAAGSSKIAVVARWYVYAGGQAAMEAVVIRHGATRWCYYIARNGSCDDARRIRIARSADGVLSGLRHMEPEYQ